MIFARSVQMRVHVLTKIAECVPALCPFGVVKGVSRGTDEFHSDTAGST